MKRGILVLILLVCIIFISSDAYAKPGVLVGSDALISTGGAYRLSPLTGWRITGATGSDLYQLTIASSSGCCCKVFAPCISK